MNGILIGNHFPLRLKMILKIFVKVRLLFGLTIFCAFRALTHIVLLFIDGLG